jgi:hypothetical protein
MITLAYWLRGAAAVIDEDDEDAEIDKSWEVRFPRG